MTTPHVYEIRIDGHLDNHWTARLGGARPVHHADGTTTLIATLDDAAAVHGILTSLRDIGATLLSLDTPAAQTGADAETPERPMATPVLPVARTTERLTLRPALPEDADLTWRYRQLPEVGEWLTGTPDTVDDYRSLFLDPDRLASTIIVELGRTPHGVVIGDFMLRREDAWAQVDVQDQARGRQAELGWVLDPVHTGHGYATEAVRELLRYCFTELGVHRVHAGCFLANEASWRLMERLGMRRETHAVKDALHRSGRWLDSLSYALLGEEWITIESAARP